MHATAPVPATAATPSGSSSARLDLRILVLAPTSNDARLTVEFLTKAGLSAQRCTSMDELCTLTEAGCGGLLLAEEALANGGSERLAGILETQPYWSDLPVVFITRKGEERVRPQILAAIGPVGNVTIIERPVRPATLVSTFRFALASRARQYQLRAVMMERDAMVARLHEADRRKDEFLAMLAHELRNPIASVANAVSLLKSSADPECHEWSANVIDRQIRQLVHLIDDLLDVSRITTGKIRLRKEVLDAALILDRACESVRPMIKARNHELICRYKHSSMWLEADPTRLEQIMLNLLTNAAKYTPSGGLIQLSAAREGTEIVIQVSDNGMGIAPERLPEMFKLFAQGERSIARSEGGLGIGLTIVQKLAELHDGRVEAHSKGANRGSTFIIRRPAAAAPVRTIVPRVPMNAAEVPALRLLIVDDNVDSAEGLARILSREGHDIRLAHDGPQALALVTAHSPQAIVMDIGLPGMDGYEVARRLRKSAHGAHVLLIAVTGYGQDEDRQQAFSAGFDHHLIKPVDLAEVKRLLSEVSAAGTSSSTQRVH
jgi:signal transduction histidine kinase/ActR/RegA family two-component response regulator